MGMMLIISIGLPEAFKRPAASTAGCRPRPWWSSPTPVVRFLHLGLFALAGRDPEMAAAVRRFGGPVVLAMTLLLVGSYLGGWAQIVLYSAAVVMDIAGAYWGRGAGWALNPAHFAERHGLIVIIALGESIVAIGAGASALPLSLAISVTALLGLTIAACLWWVYFDITALAAERNLSALTGAARNRAARDAYSLMHWPMIAGIVLLALGVKKTVTMVGTEPFELAGHVEPLAAVSLAGGVALYLLGDCCSGRAWTTRGPVLARWRLPCALAWQWRRRSSRPWHCSLLSRSSWSSWSTTSTGGWAGCPTTCATRTTVITGCRRRSDWVPAGPQVVGRSSPAFGRRQT